MAAKCPFQIGNCKGDCALFVRNVTEKDSLDYGACAFTLAAVMLYQKNSTDDKKDACINLVESKVYDN